MAAALKKFFDRKRVERIADELVGAWSAFPRESFVEDASRGLSKLELLDRARHIADAMTRSLPENYPRALAIVLRSVGPRAESGAMAPFHFLPHTLFVATRGLDDPEESLAAQRELTQFCSCEFAIRPFIEKHQAQTMKELARWTRDPNEHVRRLVSEGTRPRLPWAPRLSLPDPTPVLALLEALKDDPSEYVRRSVANNLNDISKDHPDAALATCEAWLRDASASRRKLVLHALRSLVRAGNLDAIRLCGGSDGAIVTVQGEIEPKRARIGESIQFVVRVTNPTEHDVVAVLSLRVHFVKARGGTAPKSFKLPTTRLVAGGKATVKKTISLRQHATRTHYAGNHRVEIVVNGAVRPLGRFVLDEAG